jgi:F-type H+-transporting ATPase subunit b
MTRNLRTTVLGAAVPAAFLALPSGLLAAEGHEGGGGEPWFIPSTFLWALASFVVVLLVLTKKLLPPILGAMDKRAQEIRDALGAAEKARAEASEMIKAHEASLDAARRQAAEIVEEGKRDAVQLKTEIVESARKEAEEAKDRSLRELRLAKDAAVSELDRRAVQLSLHIATRLIGKNLSEEEQKALIQERLAGFEFRNN